MVTLAVSGIFKDSGEQNTLYEGSSLVLEKEYSIGVKEFCKSALVHIQTSKDYKIIGVLFTIW
jgi:hypothetical protein